MDPRQTRDELQALVRALSDDQVETVKLFVQVLLDPGGPNQVVRYIRTMSEHDGRILEDLAQTDVELGPPVVLADDDD
ncbi:MAG: hypothetical protein KF901_28105 [Myxococcales bacterium]|nr:hypothetical protein [Myxococcales bacterium]